MITLITDKMMEDLLETRPLNSAPGTSQDAMGGGGGQHTVPLIRFSVCRLVQSPGAITTASSRQVAAATVSSPLGSMQPSVMPSVVDLALPERAPSASGMPLREQDSASAGDGRMMPQQSGPSTWQPRQASGAAILAFKKLELQFGPLDFETDQAFLESLYLYINALPLADLWQVGLNGLVEAGFGLPQWAQAAFIAEGRRTSLAGAEVACQCHDCGGDSDCNGSNIVPSSLPVTVI